MDNIAVEAHSISCLLPLIAFILLAFQFCCHSSTNKSQSQTSCQVLEEFPYRMGGLISITAQLENKDNTTSCDNNDSTCSVRLSKQKENLEKQYLFKVGRQALEFGKCVLDGCNAGLAKMIHINKIYYASRKHERTVKYDKEQRRKRNNSLPREPFEATRLVTIVQGLQY